MLLSIFSALLISGMMASVLILFAIIFRQTVLKRASRTMMLFFWALILVKLLVPVTLPSPVSIYNHTGEVTANLSYGAARESQNPAVSAAVPDTAAPSAQTEVYAVPVTPSQPEESPAAAEAKSNPENHLRTLMPIGAVVWLCGAAVMFGILLAMALLTAAKVKNRKPLRHPAIEKFIHDAGLSNRNVYSLEGIKSPFVIGCFRQSLIVPAGFDLSAPDLPYILQHELCHMRRHDNLWNFAALFALCLHWFNPLVWIAYFLSSKDIEITCDESVLRRYGENRRTSYADMLLQFSSHNTKFSWKEGFVMGFGKPSVKERIKAIIGYRNTKKIVLVLSLSIIFCIAAVFGTGAMKRATVTNGSAPSDENTGTETPAAIFDEPTASALESDVSDDESADETTTDTNAAEPAIDSTTESSESSKPAENKVSSAATTSSGKQADTTVSTGSVKNTGLTIKIATTQATDTIIYDDDGRLIVTSTFQLSLWSGDQKIPNKEIAWFSDNGVDISVDSNGILQSYRCGCLATITATYKGKTAELKTRTHFTGCLLDEAVPQQVSIDVIVNGKKVDTVMHDNNIWINATDKVQLISTVLPSNCPDKSVAYSSSDPSVVSVDASGNLSGLKSGGRALIYATAVNGVREHVYVNVN